VTPEAQAYLEDYGAILDAVPHPSFVVDHRWDVILANGAFRTLFREAGPHPTAMPEDNFLRYVLFHPDAPEVLGEHESRWCLPMLAHFAHTVERHGHDHVIQAIRREIAQDPLMEAAYRQGLPHWVRAVGAQAVEHDGVLRPLRHPDPRRGAGECRVVVETSRALEDLGYRRLTLVLRDPRRTPSRARRPRTAAAHLRVVPAAD
jgi:PAS domain-containing protein